MGYKEGYLCRTVDSIIAQVDFQDMNPDSKQYGPEENVARFRIDPDSDVGKIMVDYLHRYRRMKERSIEDEILSGDINPEVGYYMSSGALLGFLFGRILGSVVGAYVGYKVANKKGHYGLFKKTTNKDKLKNEAKRLLMDKVLGKIV
ncbi:MAG: hypothetical protein ABIJ08_03745 [Nanoarchaeota archaeon]